MKGVFRRSESGRYGTRYKRKCGKAQKMKWKKKSSDNAKLNKKERYGPLDESF